MFAKLWEIKMGRSKLGIKNGQMIVDDAINNKLCFNTAVTG